MYIKFFKCKSNNFFRGNKIFMLKNINGIKFIPNKSCYETNFMP